LATENMRLQYRYTVGERSWDLDWTDLTLDDFALLRRVTGYSYVQLCHEHDQGDALALKGVWWLARRRAGEDKLPFDDPSMNPRMGDFRRDVIRDDFPDSASGAAPDPTEPAQSATSKAG
jgi:hypothetical protein